MKHIWKYTIPVVSFRSEVEMPLGAKVLSARQQDPGSERIQLWVEHSGTTEREDREIYIVGTGQTMCEMDEDAPLIEFIDTVIMQGGQQAGLVWHVYVRESKALAGIKRYGTTGMSISDVRRARELGAARIQADIDALLKP